MNIEELRRNPSVHEKEYVITEPAVDASGRTGVGMVARMMEDMTRSHMNKCGIFHDMLSEQGLVWVIVCSQVDVITRMPDPGETVRVFSWSGEGRFGMYARRYVMFSLEGEELLQNIGLFLLVDMQTRTLDELSKDRLSMPNVVLEGEQKLPRLAQKAANFQAQKIHVVKESEIDQNNHVNNAVYLDWAEQLFKEVYDTPRIMKQSWIQYDKEVCLGQTITMQYAVTEDSLFIKGFDNGKVYFKATLVTEPYGADA